MKTIISTALVSAILLSGCGPSDSKDASKKSTAMTQTELGKKLFFDKNLSKRGNTSCATCHNPEHAFIDARFAEPGQDQNVFIHGALSVGDDGVSLGGRNAPTAAYAMFSPKFHKMEDGTYIGGQFHDGRAATLKVQAGGPPLDPAEMQQPDKSAVIDRIKENPTYVKAFENLYGSYILDDVNASYEAMRGSIALFETTDEFAPFDSKYDRYKAGTYDFTAEEDLGYSLFFSNNNTNCASCHTLNSRSEASSKELFTNHKYENIGTPRNIYAMNRRYEQGFQDANATFEGLGKTVRASDANYRNYLGQTRVPTLRNVAVTGPYMSNGQFKKLRTVLEFYDHMAGEGGHPNNPETNEPWGNNDHNATIDYTKLENTKALTDKKIRALEAFLRTLTDKRYEHLLPALAPEGEVGN